MQRYNFIFFGLTLFISATVANAENWQEVWPNTPDSDTNPQSGAIDLDTIKAVGGEIEFWSRGELLEYRKPSSIEIPVGAKDDELQHVSCGEEGPAYYYVLERRIVDRSNKVIFSEKKSAQEQQEDKKMIQENLQTNYTQDIPSMACAYMTAKCSGAAFQWPIENKNPLFGKPPTGDPKQAEKNLKLYEDLSERYFVKFRPQCASGK